MLLNNKYDLFCEATLILKSEYSVNNLTVVDFGRFTLKTQNTI